MCAVCASPYIKMKLAELDRAKAANPVGTSNHNQFFLRVAFAKSVTITASVTDVMDHLMQTAPLKMEVDIL